MGITLIRIHVAALGHADKLNKGVKGHGKENIEGCLSVARTEPVTITNLQKTGQTECRGLECRREYPLL